MQGDRYHCLRSVNTTLCNGGNLMRSIRWGLIGGMLIVTLGAAAAQTPKALIRDTFEDSDGGWTGFGNTAKVSVTHDAARVKEGKGALQFDYGVNKGEINALLLPVDP